MLAQGCSSSRFARKSRFSLPKSEIVPPACSCVSLYLNVPSKSFPLTAPFTPIVYFPDAIISAAFLFSTTVGRSFMVFLAASRILLLLLKNAPLQIPMIKIIAATATAPIVHMIFSAPSCQTFHLFWSFPPSSRQVFRSYVSTFLTFHETHLLYEIIMSPGFFQGICPKRHLKHTVSNAFFQFCSTVPSVCPESLPPPRQVCSLSLPFSPVLPVSRGSLRQWRPPHR